MYPFKWYKHFVCCSFSSDAAVSGEKQLRLLDVGSCYNPFKSFPEFRPLAIDIAPAVAVGAFTSKSQAFFI